MKRCEFISLHGAAAALPLGAHALRMRSDYHISFLGLLPDENTMSMMKSLPAR
jgi:hypothetical protein